MTDDIDRMTDSELVRACAVEIVPHSRDTGIYNLESTPNVWRRNGLEWLPLESWDDCFMVVNAMRAKGWRFTIVSDDESGWIRFHKGTSTTGSVQGFDQRAILRAALAAVRSKP